MKGGGSPPDVLPFHRPDIGEREIEAVAEVLRSGWLTMGPKTREFEERFAARVGARFAVAVNSCTSGLHLTLDALGIGPGDEVLVPTLTFASTAATVLHCGAEPKFVDCDEETLCIDPDDAAAKCGPRTRAIMPVHMTGHPCEMNEIEKLAVNRGLFVVEDAAHALPARYRGRLIGGLSLATVFSFYATKNLTTGEGGMVTTNDESLYEKLTRRRLHGLSKDAWRRYEPSAAWRYDIGYPGFKYNLTDMAAAIGLVQLSRLDEMHERRLANVRRYGEALGGLDTLDLPTTRPYVDSGWHLYAVRLKAERLVRSRDEIKEELTEAGIGTSVHFIPLHQHSYYRDTFGCRDDHLPRASAVGECLLSLPLFAGLEPHEVDRVAETLSRILARHRR